MQKSKLVEKIQKTFIEQKKTLSVAESCTGGALASALTHRAGCSDYFLGGVVAYSNNMKISVLGVKASTIEQFGAVSEQAVVEMAEGALMLTGSDYSIAVSGIAGPTGGMPGKPVGTVWAAIGKRGGETRGWLIKLSGTREEIIRQAVVELLEHFSAYCSSTSL